MNIASLISLEDKEIVQRAISLITNDNPLHQISTPEIEKINAGALYDIARNVHRTFIANLISTYIVEKFCNYIEILEVCFNIFSFQKIDIIDIEAIPTLCEQLHISFLNSKFSLKPKSNKVRSRSKEQLIELGAVYTQSNIAKSIVESAFLSSSSNINSCKVLDFACGTGRFFENIVNMFDDKKFAILNNIYAIDIDIDALSVTRLKALTHFHDISSSECKILCNHLALKNGLRNSSGLFPEDNDMSTVDLDGLVQSGFDIIVSNPPYLVLKPNKSKAGIDNREKVQEQVSYFRNCGTYSYAIEGMLNLYQLSIERMLQMLKTDGILGVICPSTLFGDVSATKLRKHILLNNRVINIEFFAEKVPLFENVSQATNIFILQKGSESDNITITENGETFIVNIDLVKELFPANLEIPIIHSSEWNILRKLAPISKLKQCTFIRNRRGELDLSLYKDYITFTPTPFRLVRGNMIGESGIKDINGEFVKEDFILTRSQEYHKFDFNRKRLICQQISNGGLRHRLKFIFCSSSDILGNSCNYISSDEETLAKLFLILNSSILNWRFSITSSNNHINNYELDELPIIDLSKVNPDFSYSSQEELDEYIGSLYGLSKEEIKLIAI